MEWSAALLGACQAGLQPKEVRNALRTSPHRHAHWLRHLVHRLSHGCFRPNVTRASTCWRPVVERHILDRHDERLWNAAMADAHHCRSWGSPGHCRGGPVLLARAPEVRAVRVLARGACLTTSPAWMTRTQYVLRAGHPCWALVALGVALLCGQCARDPVTVLGYHPPQGGSRVWIRVEPGLRRIHELTVGQGHRVEALDNGLRYGVTP